MPALRLTSTATCSTVLPPSTASLTWPTPPRGMPSSIIAMHSDTANNFWTKFLYNFAHHPGLKEEDLYCLPLAYIKADNLFTQDFLSGLNFRPQNHVRKKRKRTSILICMNFTLRRQTAPYSATRQPHPWPRINRYAYSASSAFSADPSSEWYLKAVP